MLHPFIKQAGRIINSGQSRSLVVTGNITDLFFDENNEANNRYIPLIDLLINTWSLKGNLLIIYELNGPIRFLNREDRQKMRDAWCKLHNDENQRAIDLALAKTKSEIARLSSQPKHSFDQCLKRAEENPTYALELLRQICLCSRMQHEGVPLLWEDIIIIIEGTEFLVPEGEISRMSDIDRQRVSILRDWFSDPGFVNGNDTVLLLAESISALNEKIIRLPQVLDIEVPSPSIENRTHLIRWFNKQLPEGSKLTLWDTQEALANITAGLSNHALLQLLRQAAHLNRKLTAAEAIAKVEDYIKDQLGEDVVEFKKPEHTLKDVVGFTKLKAFLKSELIPRVQSTGKSALPGAVIGGPIGAGKTFILEAVAGELNCVVLVLKNIRSKWFGGTDILFERLRRIIHALEKSLIFVDEADTQFGGVNEGIHATERRLTGKIQAMMSDPQLRGKASWLLISARIHLLSPDIRRPGRAGSLIIPVLDPEGGDLDDFIAWMIRPVFKSNSACPTLKDAESLLKSSVKHAYAAVFAELRSHLMAFAERTGEEKLTIDTIQTIVADFIPPSLEKTRRYQTLQSLVNCTRISLLPEGITQDNIDTTRSQWTQEIASLETQGIR